MLLLFKYNTKNVKKMKVGVHIVCINNVTPNYKPEFESFIYFCCRINQSTKILINSFFLGIIFSKK